MESKIGSILTLIGGIITMIIGLAALVITLVITFLTSGSMKASWIVFLIGFLITIVILALGGLKLWAAQLMKKPNTTMKGGIIAIVVGVLSGPDLLALAGGIVGVIEAEK